MADRASILYRERTPDVAPFDIRSARLRAFDRIFLLQELAALLRQVPCKSVGVVAFTLDQQRELFRENEFTSEGFPKLADALEKLELSTVPYQALRPGSASAYLQSLTTQEIANGPVDAVIFMGSMSRYREDVHVPQEGATLPHFFYFEYDPWAVSFPESDSIALLMKDVRGSLFRFKSGVELAEQVRKSLLVMKPQ